MRVLVRADASVRIGSGHVMRCLTLAGALRAGGAEVVFACRAHAGHAAGAIEAGGFRVVLLPPGRGAVVEGPPHVAWLEDAPAADAADCAAVFGAEAPFDWLVVDHYALDARWETAMRAVARRILVIDDVADRDHDCDVLLDQNLAPAPATRYAGRVPAGSRLLLGPRFALLRPAFREARPASRREPGVAPHLFVFLGGADPDGATSRILDGLALLAPGSFSADVIVGGANPHAARIRERAATLTGVSVRGPVPDVERLMGAADLAVCAAGSVTWERCALGLPAITVAIADNQRMIGEEAARAGTGIHLGDAGKVVAGAIADAVQSLLDDPGRLANMREAARQLVDGRGATRVLLAMTGRPLVLGIATDDSSWIAPWVERLASDWRAAGHTVYVVHDPEALPETDLAFFLSCGRVARPEVLARSLHNLVVHESDLPQGRGWAPLTWQILEGRNDIPVVLIEAGAQVDRGDIYLRDTLRFQGHELCDELRAAQGDATVALCRAFVERFPEVLSGARPQAGEGSRYPRRRPEDSRLDPDRTLAEQFALLRVVDNARYPAFFDHAGHRYVLRIERLPSPEELPA